MDKGSSEILAQIYDIKYIGRGKMEKSIKWGAQVRNNKTTVPVQVTEIIISQDHPQPYNKNPLKYNSKTGFGIIRSFVNTKRSKSWDMKYHWLE